jgi:hypothetical protein
MFIGVLGFVGNVLGNNPIAPGAVVSKFLVLARSRQRNSRRSRPAQTPEHELAGCPNVYSKLQKSSSELTTLRKKSPGKALSFADFLLTLRVKASPRGNLIARYRTLINAGAFPINSWADLYRMVHPDAAPDVINEARLLWNEFKTEVKNNHGAPLAVTERDYHHDPTISKIRVERK